MAAPKSSSNLSSKNIQAVPNSTKNDAPAIDRDTLLAMYEDMLLFRRFEERVMQAYTKQKFSGFCHVYIGQEAVGVGIQKNLRPTDYMISGYRSHAQAIGKGIPPEAVMSELFGKVTGCSQGKGGSMHMFSAAKRFLGGHGIVGGQVPLATGVGFAINYLGADDICVCYLGDAASNQGQFFESLNMAATWGLPVLYVIENNRYGMGTDIRRTTSVDRLSKRALAFDMDHSEVDGMDVCAVYSHTQSIIANIRKTKRPYLLEAMTYRYKGHSVSDPGTYRTKEELEKYQAIDPIITLGNKLIRDGIKDQKFLDALDETVRAAVRTAEEFADNAPNPPAENVWTDVYAPEKKE